MKTIDQIAEEIADAIAPGLAKSIAQTEGSGHPEILRGRETMISRRTANIAIAKAGLLEARNLS